jgi:8-oxo-dGTP diphosphatase
LAALTAGIPNPFDREYPSRPIPSVHALVFRGDRVLLVKRANEPSQGLWSVPGGVIELGEGIYEAARRELQEECDIEIEVDRMLNVADNILPDERGRVRFHFVLIYLLARYVSGEARPASDALDVRWVGRAELHTLDIHPVGREIVLQAFETAGVSPVKTPCSGVETDVVES